MGNGRVELVLDEVDGVENLPARVAGNVIFLLPRRVVQVRVEPGNNDRLFCSRHQYFRSSGSHLPSTTSFLPSRGPAGSWYAIV